MIPKCTQRFAIKPLGDGEFSTQEKSHETRSCGEELWNDSKKALTDYGGNNDDEVKDVPGFLKVEVAQH